MISTTRTRATPTAGQRVTPTCCNTGLLADTPIVGPTPSLTFYVLGIQVTSSQGLTWNIAPVLSGLPSAEGGIETGLGAFIVEWHVDGQILNLSLQTPAGTAGNVTLPGTGPLTVNGAGP